MWHRNARTIGALAMTLAIGVVLASARGEEPPAVVAPHSAQDIQWFETNIRPLLAARCTRCHGPNKAHANLRLDRLDGLQRGGDSGPVLVAGKPDASLLVQAVRYQGEVQMPPDAPLPAESVALFEAWILRGAPWPDEGASENSDSAATARAHWAYQPLAEETLPDSPGASESDDENRGDETATIDRIVGARLDAAGITPAPRAPGPVLVRRLYFDLWGLPPEPEQLSALDDGSPEAYFRLVERLLASGRFGERFARHWLDLARFAESMTLRGFVLPEAWRYRDYVIEAFNSDCSYADFIREQIAGDLLPADTLEVRQRHLVATTFLALGNHNLEEQDKSQLDMDVVDEQLDVIGKAILGQTIGCARCHDHKFDPITSRDYYALAGILRNVQVLEHANVSQGVRVNYPLPEEEERVLAAHETELAALEKQTDALRAEIKKLADATGEKSTASAVAPGDLPGIVVDDQQAVQVGDWRRSTHTKPYVGEGYLHDDDQQKGEKSLTFTPALPTSDVYEVRLAYTPGANRAAQVPVTVFSAEGERTVRVDMRRAPPIDGHFVSLGKHRFELGGQAFVLLTNEETAGHVVADAVQFLPESAAAPGESSETAAESAPLAALRQQLKAIEDDARQLVKNGPQRPKVLAIVERSEIRDLAIHRGGSVHSLGEVVPRGFLSLLPGSSSTLPQQQSGRLELADWLVGPVNPLTPRVMANRVWQWLVGEGLVRTCDNFGTTGEPPSHPELLDYLARRLIASGWSVKQLAREIVLSETYRRASTLPLGAAEHDPDDRLLSHNIRRPLEAECLRDAMLSIAGRLELGGGGSTVPAGLTSDYGLSIESRRRSVYLPVFRNSILPLLEVFDFPHPSMVVGRRNRSHVVSQSLLMLSDPFVRDQAAAAATRLLSEMPRGRDAAIDRAFLQALGRRPLEAERVLACEIVAAPEVESNSKEAWTELYHVLFCSNDFRYRD